MFHACAVKIAKIDAASSPARLPGKSAMNPVTVIERNPSTGTDCKMSSNGTSTRSAYRLRAAAYPYTSVKTSDTKSAMNMRSVERAA